MLFTDYTIHIIPEDPSTVPKQTYHVNRFLLSQASHYFNRLFQSTSQFMEAHTRSVTIRLDDPLAVVPVALHFMHTGELHAYTTQLAHLYNLADLWQCEQLVVLCEECVESILCDQDVFPVWYESLLLGHDDFVPPFRLASSAMYWACDEDYINWINLATLKDILESPELLQNKAEHFDYVYWMTERYIRETYGATPWKDPELKERAVIPMLLLALPTYEEDDVDEYVDEVDLSPFQHDAHIESLWERVPWTRMQEETLRRVRDSPTVPTGLIDRALVYIRDARIRKAAKENWDLLQELPRLESEEVPQDTPAVVVESVQVVEERVEIVTVPMPALPELVDILELEESAEDHDSLPSLDSQTPDESVDNDDLADEWKQTIKLAYSYSLSFTDVLVRFEKSNMVLPAHKSVLHARLASFLPPNALEACAKGGVITLPEPDYAFPPRPTLLSDFLTYVYTGKIKVESNYAHRLAIRRLGQTYTFPELVEAADQCKLVQNEKDAWRTARKLAPFNVDLFSECKEILQLCCKNMDFGVELAEMTDVPAIKRYTYGILNHEETARTFRPDQRTLAAFSLLLIYKPGAEVEYEKGMSILEAILDMPLEKVLELVERENIELAERRAAEPLPSVQEVPPPPPPVQEVVPVVPVVTETEWDDGFGLFD